MKEKIHLKLKFKFSSRNSNSWHKTQRTDNFELEWSLILYYTHSVTDALVNCLDHVKTWSHTTKRPSHLSVTQLSRIIHHANTKLQVASGKLFIWQRMLAHLTYFTVSRETNHWYQDFLGTVLSFSSPFLFFSHCCTWPSSFLQFATTGHATQAQSPSWYIHWTVLCSVLYLWYWHISLVRATLLIGKHWTAGLKGSCCFTAHKPVADTFFWSFTHIT